MASSLCSVSFERDAKRPTRVDNEAKACLDDVALALQRSSSAKLAMVGNEDAKEQKVDDIKDYHIDVFVIGDDWQGEFDVLREHCEVVYLPRTPEISTSEIKSGLRLDGARHRTTWRPVGSGSRSQGVEDPR